jgi:DNA-binding response OmpR family regulator
VLVIDDEPSVCDLLVRGLSEDNFQVTAMADAAWLMDEVAQRRPCLIVLDLHLRNGKNGMELLKELKKAAPEVPVAILTGNPDEALREEALRLGACEFLPKPVNWHHLRNLAYLSVFSREASKT